MISCEYPPPRHCGLIAYHQSATLDLGDFAKHAYGKIFVDPGRDNLAIFQSA